MITSNSTFAEIEAQKTLDEQNIKDFLLRKMERDGRKLKKYSIKRKEVILFGRSEKYENSERLCAVFRAAWNG